MSKTIQLIGPQGEVLNILLSGGALTIQGTRYKLATATDALRLEFFLQDIIQPPKPTRFDDVGDDYICRKSRDQYFQD